MAQLSSADLPISKELFEILRCPLAVQNKALYGADAGKLTLAHNCWLVSADSGLKYPIRNGIPIMLIEEGMKWKAIPVDDLPVPPPAPELNTAPAPSSSAMSVNQTTASDNKRHLILAVVALALLYWFFGRKRS